MKVQTSVNQCCSDLRQMNIFLDKTSPQQGLVAFFLFFLVLFRANFIFELSLSDCLCFLGAVYISEKIVCSGREKEKKKQGKKTLMF